MRKSSSVFVCQNCGFESPKWVGQCPDCSSWNSMEETLREVSAPKRSGGGARRTGSVITIKLSEVRSYEHALKRVSSGMSEFDRVLGGGIVYGSVVLIGGEPGIGKSTLLTHLFLNLGREDGEKKILYIAGEESPEQILLRVERMLGSQKRVSGISNAWREQVIFCPSTDADEVCNLIEQEKPQLVIVDSIQSMSTLDLSGATGSIGQLKESTERITRTVKRLHIPTFLVGHVTKDGTIAGPKVLEHIVDAVMELSGERTGAFRLLRAIKNRFGATDEVGVFQVVESGLAEVSNPSQLFLEERLDGVAGSCLTCVMEGTRPILVEIQALVVPSQLAMPRRVARGISLPRLQLLAAVLEKHCRLPLGTADIFVNVAGGFTITEPAADLAVAMAIASSQKNQAFSKGTVCIGEVGLLGELRKVSLLDKRISECKRLGFSSVVSAKDAATIKSILADFLPPKTPALT